jgi:protein-S-isoprenylcysteine O-methyltransferase Ste14
MESINWKTVKRAAIAATFFATILMLALNFQTLTYDNVIADPGRILFDLGHSWVVSWIAVFTGETGYTLYWIQKQMNEDGDTSETQNKARVQACLTNGGFDSSSLLACADMYKEIGL